MAILQIPVRNDVPAYKFQMTLETRIFTMSFRFNTRLDLWVMDLADESQIPIFSGVPLIYGNLLFEEFVSDRKPPGEFLLVDESGRDQNPTRESLGQDLKLLYLDSEEIANV